MAQGDLVDDPIGGGEAEEESGLAGGLPLADALALGHAGDTQDARAYLRDARKMIGVQIEDLLEQRALQTSHLKLRRFTERLKAATQVLIVLIAALAGLGIAIMLVDAFTSRSVVVDAFDAPPALAARGLSGKVLASDVLDQLQKLQQATRTVSKGLNTTSAWSSDITVQAPGTGVSIGEIDRLLHARFGHDVHIEGELVQTETGALALTVRGNAVPAQTFQGAAGDLDRLAARAAEYLYGRSQPYQFAVYLVSNKRAADALAFIPAALARADNDDDRAALANALGSANLNLNQPAPAAQNYRLAIALRPYNWKAWGNLIWTLRLAQGEEAAWREAQAMLRAAAKAPKNKRPDVRELSAPADMNTDLPLSLASVLHDASHNGGAGAQTSIDGPEIANIYASMHDPASAARYMASSDPQDTSTTVEAQFLSGYDALGGGDGAAAIAPLEAFARTRQADPNLQRIFFDAPCYLGLAYSLAGRMAEAEAVFARGGPWALCYSLHGDALEHAGDLAGALRVWAQGIAVAPDLSTVYLHRGLSELNRGDLAAAGADVAAANARSPHWADPLKAWGDLLARQGRWQAALAKYDQALRYAPAWTALHQARVAAANKA